MSYFPQRTFTGQAGEPSTGTGGPQGLNKDIDEINAMFNPQSRHTGTAITDPPDGGISKENLNFTITNDYDDAEKAKVASATAHISNTSNPHSVTKAQVELGNVDNTSDMNKPVSTAQGIAINAKYTKPESGIPSSDMASAVQTSLGKANSAYQKPNTGIPWQDLESIAQNALYKAVSAYQKPANGIPKTDLNGLINISLAKADASYSKPNMGIPKRDLDAQVVASLDKADSAIQDISGKADVSALNSHTSNGDIHVTSQNKADWNGKSTVSVSASGTSTSEISYITIDGVEKKISGGTGIFVATYGSTSYADVLAAYNAGKNIIVKKNDVQGLTELYALSAYTGSGYFVFSCISGYDTASVPLGIVGLIPDGVVPGVNWTYEELSLYMKPNTGIPKTDLASSVQTSLTLADSAVPEPSSEGADGQVLATNGSGTRYWKTVSGSGTSNYNDLSNKPQINSITLSGDKSLSDLGVAAETHTHTKSEITDFPTLSSVATSGSYTDLSNKPSIPAALSSLTDDATHRLVTDTEKSTWNGKVTANNAITGSTKCKITYDSKGLVTGGSDLSASDIPSLDASKITSGTFADAMIASAPTWNAKASKPTTATISIDDSWAGSSSPYTHSVSVSGVTANSKVDIQPDSTAIAQMVSDSVTAIYISNNNGTLTAYAVGNKPTASLSLQVTVTEVV